MREYDELDRYGDMDEPTVDVDVPALGRDCAIEAIEAGGTNPVNADGECILPYEPQPGDWEELEDQIRRCRGRAPTDHERLRFSRSYFAAMEAHPGPECACKYCRKAGHE